MRRGEILETQAKIVIKRGIFIVFGFVWDCGPAIYLERFVSDCELVIDPKIRKIGSTW